MNRNDLSKLNSLVDKAYSLEHVVDTLEKDSSKAFIFSERFLTLDDPAFNFLVSALLEAAKKELAVTKGKLQLEYDLVWEDEAWLSM